MTLDRRRFLAISAAALALPGVAAAQPLFTWQGVALGARATIRLAHRDAGAITRRAAAEIDRLEDIFSLFRPDSALSRLNAAGHLDAPPFELLECLSLAGAVHTASNGRFDPTIQPLWAAHAEAGAAGRLPDARLLRALPVGWSGVSLQPDTITLNPGMALTLNGIAQGYIADRVARLLSAEGLGEILIDTGELRALGGHPGGGAWPVRLAAGGGQVALRERALATSAPLGTTFDAAGQSGHILDPRTRRPAPTHWRGISVSAPSAALADAVSTAACLMRTRPQIEAFCQSFNATRLVAAIPA